MSEIVCFLAIVAGVILGCVVLPNLGETIPVFVKAILGIVSVIIFGAGILTLMNKGATQR